MRVGNISAMMAGWPAYMKAWMARPRTTAARMTQSFWVLNMGNAMNDHTMPSIAPAAYTGRRPTLSVNRPMTGTRIAWMMCATRSNRRMLEVSISNCVDKYVIENVTTM